MTSRPEDPHPDNEEHYRDHRRPGGAVSKKTVVVNDYAHDGKAKPKPRNVESEGNS
ncbi:hypothetical protein [Devosia chinhatensis]|uniref:hypothetical protein n=1 Tax=Devosia chinhatensis TaxID=429727 RepID=UPI000A94E9AC|nr:hypothetical protein [Devosia chinhatensis]